MSEEKEIKEVVREEIRSEKTGKFRPLPRNKQTEADLARIFEYGTERKLTKYLRENGLHDDEPRFAQIVKLFREHAGKRL